MAKSGNNLVHSPPGHILSDALRKAITHFLGVLPCLVIMYHQTNLDCKGFSISQDVVIVVVALTLEIAEDYFRTILWLITILSLFDQRYCPDKH